MNIGYWILLFLLLCQICPSGNTQDAASSLPIKAWDIRLFSILNDRSWLERLDQKALFYSTDGYEKLKARAIDSSATLFQSDWLNHLMSQARTALCYGDERLFVWRDLERYSVILSIPIVHLDHRDLNAEVSIVVIDRGNNPQEFFFAKQYQELSHSSCLADSADQKIRTSVMNTIPLKDLNLSEVIVLPEHLCAKGYVRLSLEADYAARVFMDANVLGLKISIYSTKAKSGRPVFNPTEEPSFIKFGVSTAIPGWPPTNSAQP